VTFGTIGVIGGGAWGTALAALAAYGGRKVLLWMRNADACDILNRLHQNPAYLPGIVLPPAIEAVIESKRLGAADAIIAAVPVHSMRAVLSLFAPHIQTHVPVVAAAKGRERRTGSTVTAILTDTLPNAHFILSGPTFAADVARGLPAAAVLAGEGASDIATLGNALATPSFRIYFSDDIAGVEFGGAMKNVLAIACGMCAGMKLGDSARAALITRSAAELSRLGRALGIRYETLNGLACLGDLILTAMSSQSRNFSLGLALGEGRTLSDALATSRGVCEGVYAAPEIVNLAGRLTVETPISDAVAVILSGRSTPAAQMAELLGRPLKAE
jgi:glycerol-3-phosphate dehydrogenase (NAD(P)+)